MRPRMRPILKVRTCAADSRTMKARPTIVALCAAAIIAVVALVLASGGSGSSNVAKVPSGTFAEAADVTTQAGGAQVAIAGTVSAPDLSTSLTLSGTGHVNFDPSEAQLTFTMSGFPATVQAEIPGGTLTMNEIYKSATLYMESSLFAGKLPDGARWIKLDLASVSEAMGLDPSSLASSGANPAQYLSYLKDGAGTATVVGHEAVRGVPTTHYQSELNLLKAAEAQPGTNRAQARAAFQKLVAETGQSSLPVEVWLDAQDHVRRMSLTIDTAAGGNDVQTKMRSEYFDFGATSSVTPPAEAEVYDATESALQGLGAG
jgi:hypothetical protein